MNEVFLILSRKSGKCNNPLYIVTNGEVISIVGNITGLYRSATDKHTYAFLRKGEYIGLVHNVVYVAEHW